jgi:hypothetical protein
MPTSLPKVEDAWERIESAPFGRDLELAVIEGNAIHKLVFPCRRVPGGWAKAASADHIAVHPTHWRIWAK